MKHVKGLWIKTFAWRTCARRQHRAACGIEAASSPRHRLLAERLTTAIAVGAYSPGDRLPSERDLAELMGVSRVTVREAIRLVAGLGLLASVRGRDGGTFVTEADWTAIAPDVARRTLEQELPGAAGVLRLPMSGRGDHRPYGRGKVHRRRCRPAAPAARRVRRRH